jgi:hypothetical protein
MVSKLTSDFNEDPEIQSLLLSCMLSTKVTAITLFPELFFTEITKLHDQIFEAVDSGHKLICVAAPRGLGKTTIARTVAAKAVLFRLAHFICYVMNSSTVAEMQTENLKRDLLSTPEVRQFFGNIKTDVSTDTGLEEFSKMAWTAYGEVLVFPRGAGQQIRGLNWNNHRPQLIIVDDLEKQSELKSAENRQSIKKWFYSDLMKSVDRYSNNYCIIYIDTLKHEDSLLAELMEDPLWLSIKLSLAYEDENEVLKSNLPSYMTDNELQIEYENHKRRGDLDTFYSEFMNEPTSKGDISFNKKHFKYFSETDPDFLAQLIDTEYILIGDPAKTVKMQSADSALMVIAINPKLCRYSIMEVFSDKLYPDEFYDKIFEYVVEYSIINVGIEVTSLHQYIVQPIKNEMIVREITFNLIELKTGNTTEDGKAKRIAKLVPYYRKGYIYHRKGHCEKLEAQLESFPKSRLWDCMDCLAYLPKMLEMGDQYFTPDLNEDDPEAEYAELEASYEPALDDSWRII